MNGKVVFMSEPGRLELREYEVPDPEPGAAVAKVRRANVCGSEVHIFDGHHPLLKSAELGHEMVGEIAALGEGLTTDYAGRPLKVGDRISPVYFFTCRRCAPCSRGDLYACEHAYDWWTTSPDRWPHFHATLATHYYLHPNQAFYTIPDNVSDEVASIANCALAQVIFGLDRVNIQLDETVLVQGAGGLGLCAIAYAKERGARVIVIDGVASRLELAREFGADEVIDLSRTPERADRVARVMELTGSGADVGIEVAGVPDAFAEGIHHLRMGGRYVEVGNISPGRYTEFDPGLLTRRCLTLHAVNRYNPPYLDRALRFLSRVADRYPFDKLVSECFPLSETEAAIDQSRRRAVGRAAVNPELS
ncbi:MAG TPA: zinc-binding dehydrogenase [Pseudonocardia sp.]|jgi:threonine dehydrogenase-like Zn-dependent dehydrogenase|nr:zinc-binding dehydrogenase [Pseudonocardia sp.]